MADPITQVQRHFLSMGATVVSPWIISCGGLVLLCTVSCGANSAPVGVISVEATIETDKVQKAVQTGLDPADMQVFTTVVDSVFSRLGTDLVAGYNGVGAKFTQLTAQGRDANIFAAVRFRYTRTSGGASDTLQIRVVPVQQQL